MADDGGIARLQLRLAAIPAEVKAAVRPALLQSAQDIAATVRSLAPEDTGALKDSVEVTPPGGTTPAYSQPGGSTTLSENAAAVTVGNHAVRYAHLVEYGTKAAPAQPFFWPAVRLHQKKVAARIKRAVGKAVRGSKGK